MLQHLLGPQPFLADAPPLPPFHLNQPRKVEPALNALLEARIAEMTKLRTWNEGGNGNLSLLYPG